MLIRFLRLIRYHGKRTLSHEEVVNIAKVACQRQGITWHSKTHFYEHLRFCTVKSYEPESYRNGVYVRVDILTGDVVGINIPPR